MNYLDYAYEINQLDKFFDRSYINANVWKIKDLIESDASKEDLADGFFDVLNELISNMSKQLDEAYDDGYHDGKDAYEDRCCCDCDCHY